MPDLTWMEDSDGDAVECYDCGNQAAEEYRGYCPACWKDLSDKQRAALVFEPTTPPPLCASCHTGIVYRDYYGHCPACWVKLTDEQRTALRNVVKVEIASPEPEVRVVRHIDPDRPWARFFWFLWAVWMTIGMALLHWKK